MQPTFFKPVYIPYHTKFKLIEQSHNNCIYQNIYSSDFIHPLKIPCIEGIQSSLTIDNFYLTPQNLRKANLIKIDNTQRNKRIYQWLNTPKTEIYPIPCYY
ncbi:hypothetical protein EDI_044660 [Entamoeba dispar SAW760]|uniref:Uncharacterized protein n=1 Tax=Entamoeba dispar (strain ATCC PRA-260 / SAW760) TaxID=370354 RepID=B0EHW6_ENTDS|nr:uncharacterized protein EDI_044660 [Entamoeba dispar SAW760]EDR25910.1 hypothetical protein EDI_044660 [Entamoeba dispar SAW760]|eukprot:EDR25910.1 hypothetical protein EDI_044660 [Entamoeba dispar SAW760]